MNYTDFVTGITSAYAHKGGIKTLLLGSLSDSWFQKIQAECSWIIEHAGSSDVSQRTHVTNWTRPTGEVRQFSLFNMSGDTADTKGDYGYLGDAKKKRLVFPELTGLAQFARLFQPALRNLRLNGMGGGSSLNAHEEMSITAGKFSVSHIVRFHLPVFTNETARVYLDDEAFQYREGDVYFFNHGCVHAAANWGSTPRYHLVLDCFLDRPLVSRLFPGAPASDPEFMKTSDDTARMEGEPWHFPNFVLEDGTMITGDVDYGRRVPGPLDFYRKNYPSIFGKIHDGARTKI